jgi:hypothetical protein
MSNDHLQEARDCQRAAYEWLTLARNSHDEQERTQLLAVAEAWLEIAHDMFERAHSATSRVLH